jgi:hypothetical protein
MGGGRNEKREGSDQMANKRLFESIVGKLIPKTDARNEAMAPAYAFSPKHALAQYAATGCLNSTFYASAEEQLAQVIEFCRRIDAEFIARTAIYTRHRKGATSKVRCIDVAALVTASIVRRNPRARVIPFSDDVVSVSLNARDSVMTNAAKLAGLPSGGTNCSAPLRLLNRREATGELVIYVSDNQSWVDVPQNARYGGTETMRQWAEFKTRNREARMVCIDIQPYSTTQAKEREDILNIGGFSDQVFDLIALFAAGRLNSDYWVDVIEKIAL